MLYIREVCKRLEREGIYYFRDGTEVWCKVEREGGKIQWYNIIFFEGAKFEYGEIWAESAENKIKVIIEEKEMITKITIRTSRKN